MNPQSFTHPVTVSTAGCVLTPTQIVGWAEEFFGHVEGQEVHFSQEKFAVAFAEMLGVSVDKVTKPP